MEPIIKTKDLSKKFRKQNVVNNLDITVNKGDVYGFLGPNGAGKSTTIKMMLGLVAPTEGSVWINGVDVSKDREKAISKIGAMVEFPSFYGNMTGYSNLVLYANIYGQKKSRIDEVLEMVGLGKDQNKKVSQYSMGMKQRLAIARAFINHPEIVILDEPTNGLDPQGCIEIRNLIQSLAEKERVTFILCSHILSEVQAVCNRVGIIDKGALLVEGNVQELLDSDFDRYFIEIQDKNKAIGILKTMNEVSEIDEEQKGLMLKVKKYSFEKINKALVMSDVSIKAVNKIEVNLEDYFLDVVGR